MRAIVKINDNDIDKDKKETWYRMQSCQNFIYKVNYEQRLKQIYKLPMDLEKK